MSATTNNLRMAYNSRNVHRTWISTPAPEIVTSQYFEGTHSLKVYEDPINFYNCGGAQ